MKKFLKWAAIVVGSLALLLFIAFKYLQHDTKKASPETTSMYSENGKEIVVTYSRPSVKGRAIFGKLIPYNEVWRTGANEATTFITKSELIIGGKLLPAGKYTLWTIPQEQKWTVIFNRKQYSWGVSMEGVASREPEADVLTVDVPVQALAEPVEMFTIDFDKGIPAITMAWEKTSVSVPFK
jgi:hypothetical protein